jgi:hypothetical protein
MRCGDVERKPGLCRLNHMGVSKYTRGDLEDMLIWKDNPCFEDAMEAAGRTTRSQVQDQVWTVESVRASLTGGDTLGLGIAIFGREFMLQLCTRPTVTPREEHLPPQPEATGTPPEEIPSQAIKAAIIPLMTPPMAIPTLPHRIPTPKGDLLPDQR